MRERRIAAGLRQLDVAKKMDVDQAAVSKWESGETRPSRKYHKKLARLYGCTVAELFEEDGKCATTAIIRGLNSASGPES